MNVGSLYNLSRICGVGSLESGLVSIAAVAEKIDRRFHELRSRKDQRGTSSGLILGLHRQTHKSLDFS